ncbi:hypothetical protein [Neobacillus drentensis]|uniref:hypothetical protein n=1 Tax=Neobacillus drentensis TaxID=220684 RepID=UPI003001FF12
MQVPFGHNKQEMAKRCPNAGAIRTQQAGNGQGLSECGYYSDKTNRNSPSPFPEYDPQ